jgi:hypothetical protein
MDTQMPPNSSPQVDPDDKPKANFESVNVRSAMLTGIFLLLVMYTLYAAATLFMPLMVAFLTSLIFTPVVRALRVLKIPPPVSAAVVVMGVLGLGFGALYGLSEPAMEWLQKAPRDLRQLEQEFHQFSEPMQQLKLANAQIEDITPRGRQPAESRGSRLEPGEVDSLRHLVSAVRHHPERDSAVFHAGVRRHFFTQTGAGDSPVRTQESGGGNRTPDSDQRVAVSGHHHHHQHLPGRRRRVDSLSAGYA